VTQKATPDGTSGAAPDFLTSEEQAQEEDARQWRQVSDDDVEETKVTFDNMNEPFVGTYRGSRIIENENGKFTQYLFEHNELRYFINAGWSLIQGMRKVLVGQTCRITWINNRDTGMDTPMRVMRVDVARPAPGTPSPRAQVMR
jgi:hypothetical protein